MADCTPAERAAKYGLEPGAIRDGWDLRDPPSEAEVELSRSISLKRVADALEEIAKAFPNGALSAFVWSNQP